MDELKNSNMQYLSKYKLKEYLENESVKVLYKIKLYLDDLYYNTGESNISNLKYDMLKDFLLKRNPNFVSIGAVIRKDSNRALLPYWMGSTNKIVPGEQNKLDRWKLKNKASTYVLSDKLDGVSALFVSNNGIKKLYTRGDGNVGANISYLIKYFNIPDVDNIVVRGEMIIRKNSFKKFYRKINSPVSKSDKKSYRNARNMVSGLIGAKTIRHGINKIHFVAYEIVKINKNPKQSDSLKKLNKLGFETVNYSIVKKITMNQLSKLYAKRKKLSKYDIDGIIVQSDKEYLRNSEGNPKYMFAFKEALEENFHETVVKHVEWNVSKWGQLKPVVLINPVDLKDITINRVTAHNASYVELNGIGPGAIIRVTRSKDVIPYIVDIIKSTKPQMPDVSYTWDKNHVNIIIKADDSLMCIKLINGIFSHLGIKQVSIQTIKKIFDKGYNNLIKILKASKKQFLEIEGFQTRSANRTYDNIHNGFQNINLSVLLGSSGIFGFGIGKKRIDLLLSKIPNLLNVHNNMDKKQLKLKILKIEGFSNIMAEKVVNNVKNAEKFIKLIKKYATFEKKIVKSHNLDNMKIVMTGFRDNKMVDDIESRGGKIVGSVSKNTSILVVKSKKSAPTGKFKKAKLLGTTILQKDEFVSKYLL